MNFLEVPLTNDPNQSFTITLPINGVNIKLLIELSYKELCEYWLMSIKNPDTRKSILDSIPILCGGPNFKSSNILQQYQYLGIGSAIIYKKTETDLDSPNDKTLGNEFILIWSDDYDKLESSTN